MSFRPVWRVVICCNETPENLSVSPPMEDGIEDKIILLKVSPVDTPMPATSPDQKLAFQLALKEELPMFLNYIDGLVVPDHLADPEARSGVIAWKDADLLESVEAISPERQLESLLALSIDKGSMPSIDSAGTWMSAADVQSALQAQGSVTASQANPLLKYGPACGRYLSTLSKKGSPYVSGKEIPKQIGGITHYLITCPSS